MKKNSDLLMKKENFTFWKEINKLFKLEKFRASQQQTEISPPFQKIQKSLVLGIL